MSAPRPAGRRPGAFRLDDPAVEATGEPTFEALELEADAVRAVDMIAHPRRQGVRWGALALSTGGALISLWLALTLDSLVRAFFAWVGWLGWLGIALVGAFLIALAVIIGRELAGLFRLKQLARLRLQSDEAALKNDRDAAVIALRSLIALYGRIRQEGAGSWPEISARLSTGAICSSLPIVTSSHRSTSAPSDLSRQPRGGLRWSRQ